MDNPRARTVATPAGATPGSSLRVVGPFEAAGHPRYCPLELLASFALLMAGHGRCVNTDMMLGDREYAMRQLACARALNDAELAAIAIRLLAYFDDSRHGGMAVMGRA